MAAPTERLLCHGTTQPGVAEALLHCRRTRARHSRWHRVSLGVAAALHRGRVAPQSQHHAAAGEVGSRPHVGAASATSSEPQHAMSARPARHPNARMPSPRLWSYVRRPRRPPLSHARCRSSVRRVAASGSRGPDTGSLVADPAGDRPDPSPGLPDPVSPPPPSTPADGAPAWDRPDLRQSPPAAAGEERGG